jgi:crotonobetainyl-CoA:carnitine CoA-transferase CaiB-like acyl-CoA transferase
VGNDQVPTPIKLLGEELPLPARAPTAGQHTEAILAEVLGHDADRIARLRAAGALGAPAEPPPS